MRLHNEETFGEGGAAGGSASPSVPDDKTVADTGDTAAASSTAADDQSSAQGSSPSAGAKTESMLDRVNRVLEETRAKEGQPAPASNDGSPPSEGEIGKQEPAKAGAADEDLQPIKDPKTANDHRWNRLLKERRAATEERDSLAPKAQQYDQLDGWIKERGITPDEFAAGLNIIALTKVDPVKALEALRPMVAALERDAGVVRELPEDLQDAVDNGSISEDFARKYAEERLKRESTDRRFQERTAQDEQRRQQEERVTQWKQAEVTFSRLDAEQVAKDPDFARKRPFVQKAVALASSKLGRYPTPQEAAKMFSDAVKEVDSGLSALMPPRREIRPMAEGAKTNAVKPQPRSTREAFEMGYQKT